MTTELSSTRYWLFAEARVAGAAAVLSVVGVLSWFVALPKPPFGPADLIVPSCLTWAILSPFVARAGLRRAILIGLLSPILGSVFVVLLRIGPVGNFQSLPITHPIKLLGGFAELVLYGFAFIGITSWVTLPIGAATGLLMRAIFRQWPPPPRAPEWEPRPGGISSLRSVYVRLALSALPLIPLLTLLFPYETPQGPREVVSLWRILGDLYFFPVMVLHATGVSFGWRLLQQPVVDVALRFAFASLLSAMLYRWLTRRAVVSA